MVGIPTGKGWTLATHPWCYFALESINVVGSSNVFVDSSNKGLNHTIKVIGNVLHTTETSWPPLKSSSCIKFADQYSCLVVDWDRDFNTYLLNKALWIVFYTPSGGPCADSNSTEKTLVSIRFTENDYIDLYQRYTTFYVRFRIGETSGVTNRSFHSSWQTCLVRVTFNESSINIYLMTMDADYDVQSNSISHTVGYANLFPLSITKVHIGGIYSGGSVQRGYVKRMNGVYILITPSSHTFTPRSLSPMVS